MDESLPPTDPKQQPESALPAPREVQEIQDPAVGLAIQFIVATMLSQGIVELRVPGAMIQQAMDKLITATMDADGGFTVRLFR